MIPLVELVDQVGALDASATFDLLKPRWRYTGSSGFPNRTWIDPALAELAALQPMPRAAWEAACGQANPERAQYRADRERGVNRLATDRDDCAGFDCFEVLVDAAGARKLAGRRARSFRSWHVPIIRERCRQQGFCSLDDFKIAVETKYKEPLRASKDGLSWIGGPLQVTKIALTKALTRENARARKAR